MGEKAPGPDGFSFKFIKKNCEILKGDMINKVRHFVQKGTFSPGCNSSFISLFPKVNDLPILRNIEKAFDCLSLS